MSLENEIGENGFAILPRILSSEKTDQLIQEIESLSPRRSRAGVRHALTLEPVATLARGPEMLDIAREILGSAAFPFRATLFEKSPVANWLVVWHQDTALPLKNRLEVPGWGPWSVKEGITYAHAPASALSQVLALRLSLDDSGADNGPLRVLPGTHTLGVLSDDKIHDIAGRIEPVDCTIGKGGIVAMRPLVIHASSKCTLDAPRKVLHIEYAASSSIATPLELALA
jgi:ectoine hydroxylase-related dioxygenase (phytanoyl-CoA dioxygenase family)